MKRSKKLFSIGIALTLISMSALPAFAAQQKIGYIDVSTAFDKYNKTVTSDAALEKTRLSKKEAREAMIDEIKRLKDELELMNDKGKEEKQAAIDQKISALHEFERASRDDLRRQRDAMVRDILKEMDEVIKQYGAKEGYSAIFDDRALLYKSDTLDLTDKIIEILNSNE